METFVVKLRTEVEGSLAQIESQNLDMLSHSEQAIRVLEQAFTDLKRFVIDYTFACKEEEIRFFKETKPKLFCMLIYYRKLYNIEMNRPKGGEDEQRKYLSQQLCLLKDYFDRNRDFYHYWRAGEQHMDEHYFLRNRAPLHLTMESFYFERDPRFSTAADFKMAKVMGNDKVEEYLCAELAKLNESGDNALPFKEKLTWSLKKVFLIELIYLLHWAGAFNNGKASLKSTIAYFEKIFNIDLGENPSTSMSEVKERKRPFPFLALLNQICRDKQNEG